MSEHNDTPDGTVYMLLSDDAERIKIGWTGRAIAKRRQEIEAACGEPVAVYRLYDGGRSMERKLHEILAHARLLGEWFVAVEVMQWVARDEAMTAGMEADLVAEEEMLAEMVAEGAVV